MGELVLKQLTKRFDDVTAVDRVSLRIPDREFLVLLGPSGCGKSTILRLVAGLADVTSGEITLDGKLLNFADPVKRNVAMVFQNYALYPHMTVRKNIAFPLETARLKKDAIERGIGRAAEILEIGDLLGRYPEQLSGGQRQRVALARAVVRQPAAFLMDEPLSNLDAQLRLQTRHELMGLHQELGITTVYVTHDQVEAMTMGQRIAVMRLGQLQQVGAPKDVYDTPANTFVATFIGNPAMNLLEGAMARRGEGWAFVSPAGFEIDVDPAELATDAAELAACVDHHVQLGIRPEHLQVLPAGSTSTPGIPGRVRFIEHVGSDLYLTVVVGEGSIQVRMPPTGSASVGDNITVSFDPHFMHLFDPTGRNLRHATSDNVSQTVA